MSSALQEALDTFDRNTKTVLELLEFDAFILKFIERQLSSLDDNLKKHFQSHFPADAVIPAKYSVEATLGQVRAITTNESLKPMYRIMHGQCLVLLVSFFGSSARDLFRKMVRVALQAPNGLLDKQLLEISVRELRSPEFDLADLVASRLEETKRLSFQDMKSTGQAYALLLGREPNRDHHVNNIIVAQASRHAIVHADAVADFKMMSQLRDASPRDVKNDLAVGEPLTFVRSEIECMASSMKAYLHAVHEIAQATLSGPGAA